MVWDISYVWKKKNGSFTRKIAQSAESSETAILGSNKKLKSFLRSTDTEDEKL